MMVGLRSQQLVLQNFGLYFVNGSVCEAHRGFATLTHPTLRNADQAARAAYAISGTSLCRNASSVKSNCPVIVGMSSISLL